MQSRDRTKHDRTQHDRKRDGRRKTAAAKQQPAMPQHDAEPADDKPRDVNELRLNLARKLSIFVSGWWRCARGEAPARQGVRR